MVVKLNKDNILAFMSGLDYGKPRDQYEEGWHEAIESIRKHVLHEMKD